MRLQPAARVMIQACTEVRSERLQVCVTPPLSFSREHFLPCPLLRSLTACPAPWTRPSHGIRFTLGASVLFNHCVLVCSTPGCLQSGLDDADVVGRRLFAASMSQMDLGRTCQNKTGYRCGHAFITTGHVSQLEWASVVPSSSPGCAHLKLNSSSLQGRDICSRQQMAVSAQAARYTALQDLQHPHRGRFVL